MSAKLFSRKFSMVPFFLLSGVISGGGLATGVIGFFILPGLLFGFALHMTILPAPASLFRSLLVYLYSGVSYTSAAIITVMFNKSLNHELALAFLDGLNGVPGGFTGSLMLFLLLLTVVKFKNVFLSMLIVVLSGTLLSFLFTSLPWELLNVNSEMLQLMIAFILWQTITGSLIASRVQKNAGATE